MPNTDFIKTFYYTIKDSIGHKRIFNKFLCPIILFSWTYLYVDESIMPKQSLFAPKSLHLSLKMGIFTFFIHLMPKNLSPGLYSKKDILTHLSLWYKLKLYRVSILLTFLLHLPVISFTTFTPFIFIYTHRKGGISIYHAILKKLQQLDNDINSLQTLLASYPPGQLVCSRNGKYYKWFQSCERSQKYIPKSNRQLAEKLAEKKYMSLRLDDMINEQKALLSYLNERHPSTQTTFEQLTNAPEYKNLFSHSFTPLSQELTEWMNTSYLQNTRHPESLIYKSNSGNILRSKSESIIDMLLYINKIPFRYECALQLDEVTYFPDFTIRHPVTGRTYYWEHFGLMDKADYCIRAFDKLENYALHGIIPSIQLITTFETAENPLSVETVQNLISLYFL